MGLDDLLKIFLGHHGKQYSKHHGGHHRGHHSDCYEPYYREPGPMQRKEPEETLQCSYCSAQNKLTSNFCFNCGKRLKSQCPSCNSKIEATAKYCPECGLKFENRKFE
ncbi:MAG: zinc ribbon domain-containing protein [Clostridia bacterium]|nr:zinc ribbon domain-containing protein [Clostridia bacterium]